MVFIHFPSNYTDEETMLQHKYSKLRKKKKALEQMKVPKPEPEKVNPLKRPLDPKDAKELAKKLILSGKVSLPNKVGDEKKTVFKRPRTLERKILATGRSEGHGGLTPGYSSSYQNDFTFEPFTPAPAGSTSPPQLSPTPQPQRPVPPPEPTPRYNEVTPVNSYHNVERSSPTKTVSPSSGNAQKPKRGPTIYVTAHNLSEPSLRSHFGKFGKVINVKLNNPTVGFLTFDKVEAAEVAVQEMNGMTIDDISYDVQFARRQPNITQMINDSSASASWTAIATSHSQKSSHQDRRPQVVYDD